MEVSEKSQLFNIFQTRGWSWSSLPPTAPPWPLWHWRGCAKISSLSDQKSNICLKIQDDKTQTITMATRWQRREAQSCSGRRWVVNSGQLSWYQLFSENISNSLIFNSDSVLYANIVSSNLKQISPSGRSQWNSPACLCRCHSAYKGCELGCFTKATFLKFILHKVDNRN